MTAEVWAMVLTGSAALIAGLILVRTRFLRSSGAAKILVLGPVFEAVALAIFAAEHATDARDLMGIVPHWLPAPLFWTYFAGAALLAAAISFIAWRYVRWSAVSLTLFFLLIVSLVDLPNLTSQFHDRFFWILTVRETSFGCGALILAGSQWPEASPIHRALTRIGRTILAPIFVFYGVEHFLYPHNVPGVPLEKLTPAGVPAPTVLAGFIGITLILAGVGLLIPSTVRLAAATSGAILVLLTALFYLPIMLMELRTPLAVEGVNYVGDTLLFAATALLAGSGTGLQRAPAPIHAAQGIHLEQFQ